MSVGTLDEDVRRVVEPGYAARGQATRDPAALRRRGHPHRRPRGADPARAHRRRGPHRRGAGGVRRGRRLVRDGDPAPRPARDPRSLHAVDEAHLPVALPALCRAVRQACLRAEGVQEQVSERIARLRIRHGIGPGSRGEARGHALPGSLPSRSEPAGSFRRPRNGRTTRSPLSRSTSTLRGPPPGPQRTRTTTWPAALQIGLPDHVATVRAFRHIEAG